MSTISLPSFSTSLLISYYSAQLATSAATTSGSGTAATTSSTSGTGSNSATAKDVPPWTVGQPAQQVKDAQVLNLTNFIDTSNVPLSPGSTASSKIEQDNQKLFSLYTAVSNLQYLAKMAQRSGTTSGQFAGLNTRFQAGLTQVQNFISTESFNNFTLQAATPQSSVTSSVSVPSASFAYQGGTIVADANIGNALAGVSSSDSFNIAVTKGGTVTNVAINLANISGTLSIDNIVNYVNQQLSAAGFSSRLSRVMTQGSINDPTKASYGIAITEGSGEALNLSSASATPALYLAGNSGSATATTTATGSTSTTTAADQQGRLIKLTNIAGGSPTGAFNATLNPTTGNSTAQSTVVDSNGNVYTVGTATGNFGNQLNQGTQDVVLTKYDSAGNLQWSKLLGSAGSANAYSLALDAGGNLVVAGSTTANLTTSGIGNGNTDSFVAKYDSNGNQTWVTQIPTLSNNSANSVSVDASGNIYIGGQVSGTIGSGQTNAGGQDGYVAKLDSKGNIVYEQQIGTSGTDSVAATAVASDGSLYVASVQNGNAILTKYASGNATSAPVWQENLGALGTGGSIGGIAISGGKVYLSGTSTNGALTSGGQASVIGSTSGGLDAFVASFTDAGTTVSANTVTYIGTSGTDTAGQLTVDSSGTVYLTGTTTGTFAGQTRSAIGTQNAFVTALNSSGNVNWTQQYGGASGTSTGAGVAIDPTGSSVLDALGLPRGTIDINQTVDLSSVSTLRAGDSFQIKIDNGAASNTATITIDAGETLQSLTNKLNIALGSSGKASVTYNNGEALKIAVNKGISATLIAGPTDFNALGRLGLAAGTIANGVTTTNTSSSSALTGSSSSSATKQTFGLGFSAIAMDLSTSSDAGAAAAQLLTVLSSISNAYRTSNAPPSSGTSSPGNYSGTAPAYLTNQTASYQNALNMLMASQSSTSSGSLIG
ncbi:MAG: hypothetical protein KGR48_14865 [Alphaproteobacteria bacterium]|nr:hypothetical protein [Alphaproteobacteria bacterium]